MNVFGFYKIFFFGLLGGFAMAWIFLCYKTFQAAHHNKKLQLSILEQLQSASHKAIRRVSQTNDE